jgi:hypothetical protein
MGGVAEEFLDDLGWTPLVMCSVAQVSRRSCQRMTGTPVPFRSGFKCRLITFCASTGVPTVVLKTSLESL